MKTRKSNQMTYKEAIEILETDTCYECSYGCTSAVSCESENCEYRTAIELAVETLEKQIPIKPIEDDELRCFICPKCDAIVCLYNNGEISHCECGQAIDWSK